MFSNSMILNYVKSELADAQKAFARNPSSGNWERTTRAMLVFQQLEQLLRRAKTDLGIKAQLSNLDMVTVGEWPERIVKISLNMSIAEVLA